jgi:Tfp pilus assembly protein PilF
MAGKRIIGRSFTICAVVLGLAAAPALAQTGGMKGKVVDAQGKPVDGATVTLVQQDTNSKFNLKSKKGEFLQIGLPPGNYVVTVEKDGLKATANVRVGLEIAETTVTLRPGGGGSGAPMTKEEAAKAAAKMEGLKAAFAEGAALSNAGKHDEAIAKFNQVIAEVPKCTECYINIGATNAQKKDYVAAEAAYKKALELDPNSVESYYGLAAVYNDQKKFTEAQAMSAEASKRSGAAAGAAGAAGGGGANADVLYNQGVIAWNANDFAKAQEHFAAAVAANPNHAESHFMLGRTNLNLGKLPEAAKEFEAYLKIAPNGPNAKEAQTNFEQLKSFIK